MTKKGPLVEMLGGDGKPLVELLAETDVIDQKVELLGRDRNPLEGIGLKVVQLLTGGSVHEVDTRHGIQVDVLAREGVDPEDIREVGWRMMQLKEKLGV